jgi:hypothetical protein
MEETSTLAAKAQIFTQHRVTSAAMVAMKPAIDDSGSNYEARTTGGTHTNYVFPTARDERSFHNDSDRIMVWVSGFESSVIVIAVDLCVRYIVQLL